MFRYYFIAAAWLFLMWEGAGTRCVLHIESPQYPHLARMARIQGEVKIHAKISCDGKVISVTTESGHTILKREVEENVKKWVFAPGGERNIEIFYEFRLEEPEVTYTPPAKITFDLPYRVLIVSNFPAPTD